MLVRDSASDAFDVVLSDGTFKLKCLLSTALNSAVKFGYVREHDAVRVTSYTRRYDETDLEGDAIVVVRTKSAR